MRIAHSASMLIAVPWYNKSKILLTQVSLKVRLNSIIENLVFFKINLIPIILYPIRFGRQNVRLDGPSIDWDVTEN